MITITKTIKINATLNATITTRIIGAITTMTVMTMSVITINDHGHGRHWYHGRYWDYGVGPCWQPTPVGFVWVCGY